MDWGLFFQIEVILLTIGFVVSFVNAMHQDAKDKSFTKRVIAFGKVFEEYSKGIAETMKKKEETK